jgi:glycine cleavage system aminomethyltransferase T
MTGEAEQETRAWEVSLPGGEKTWYVLAVDGPAAVALLAAAVAAEPEKHPEFAEVAPVRWRYRPHE